jgi:hypothetical protein
MKNFEITATNGTNYIVKAAYYSIYFGVAEFYDQHANVRATAKDFIIIEEIDEHHGSKFHKTNLGKEIRVKL